LTARSAQNREHRLTGPQALSYDDAASITSKVSGRTVRHRAVDAEEYVEFLVQAGYSAEFAGGLAALDEHIRDGKESHVTDAVQRLNGRPPCALEEFLRTHSGTLS
jgi:uncharacterized protein YbjT (DUF2867 family)